MARKARSSSRKPVSRGRAPRALGPLANRPPFASPGTFNGLAPYKASAPANSFSAPGVFQGYGASYTGGGIKSS